jgi:membrane dipeptidase
MWSRRQFLTASLSLSGSAWAAARAQYSRRAVELVRETTVIDMLGLVTLDWARFGRWEHEAGAFGPADFDKLRRSGITVFNPAVELGAANPFAATSTWLGDWNKFLEGHPGEFVRVEGAADFGRAKSEGKIGIILGFQNSDHFRTTADVRFFYGLGQRVSQLTYNAANPIGCGCTAARDGGLTDYGAQVVEAMNAAGMAVDVSHCGDRTSLDAIRASKKPVLITHANCRALNPHNPRCKPDPVIREMAARGGVMGITSIQRFVCGNGLATLEDVLDHFDHVARVAGIEHLGVGSDNDLDGRDHGHVQLRMDIRGLDHPRRMFDLTEGLVRRGYTDRHIRAILGGNFGRVLDEIWPPQF